MLEPSGRLHSSERPCNRDHQKVDDVQAYGAYEPSWTLGDDEMLLDEPGVVESALFGTSFVSDYPHSAFDSHGLGTAIEPHHPGTQQPRPSNRPPRAQVQQGFDPQSYHNGFGLERLPDPSAAARPDLSQYVFRQGTSVGPSNSLSSSSMQLSFRRSREQDPPIKGLGERDSSVRSQEEREHAVANFNPDYLTRSEGNREARHTRYVQGIELMSTRELPDRFRMIFQFPNFNAIQSKCFNTIFRTNDNFVLSSPTGSGKTIIFELAICRLVNIFPSGQFKIVYQAPTKSLCAERYRDWQRKFNHFELPCAELTGDSEQGQLRMIQHASIIITTPEKWDSMTRKWKDHARLMQLVKLFLIDEVHMLKEERGATLEAVVSRMKSVGSDVRFIAISATVPNSADIAAWLGKDPINQHLHAGHEQFGEEFRPVKLQKHVRGYPSNNDFALDRSMNAKLPDVISKFSQRKPIMVFCCTRKSTQETAHALANWWATKGPGDRYWEAPRSHVDVHDQELRGCISSAVAFHHAGLAPEDREAVEKGFLEGNINVICCTSTLAVGVNLPCHFVIIKNTVTYTNSGLKEYSDLEIMQMLGRAGRPQFDRTAVAVIMTQQEKVREYELMVSGQEVLESSLHLNLIEHLNAEIGLGTITNLSTAKKWLSGTFLYVRLRANPEHYNLHMHGGASHDIDDTLERMITESIDLLQQYGLISSGRQLHATCFGDTMARYCVKFDTARLFLQLECKAKLSEILSAIAQAAEFKEVRFRSGEKPIYKSLNQSPQIKFPIPVQLGQGAHKVSLIIQAQLGGVELPASHDEQGRKIKQGYNNDQYIIFQAVHRLVRCIIDFQLAREDSVALRNALMLCRSLGAKCWDDSPLQLRQLEGIGPAGVRKLVNIGIRTLEELENTEPHSIEMALGRNKPFGNKILAMLKNFPKLRVSMQVTGHPIVKAKQGATVHIKAEIGFMNEITPVSFRGKTVYAVFLAETSDGRKLSFARMSAKMIGKGKDIKFAADLATSSQLIICHVMCDEFAGTMRSASLKPTIASIAWSDRKTEEQGSRLSASSSAQRLPTQRPSMNMAKKRNGSAGSCGGSAEFDDENIDDDDMIRAAGADDLGFQHIDSLLPDTVLPTSNNTANSQPATVAEDWEPRQLRNGKWACNHQCKNKNTCKHLCCRDGLDKPPKAPKRTDPAHVAPISTSKNENKGTSRLLRGQTQLSLPTRDGDRKDKLSAEGGRSVPQIDLTLDSANTEPRSVARQALQLKRLEDLHTAVQRGRPVPNMPPKRQVMAGRAGLMPSGSSPTRSKSFSTNGNAWPKESVSFAFRDSGLLETEEMDDLSRPSVVSSVEQVLLRPGRIHSTIEPSTDELLGLSAHLSHPRQGSELAEPDDSLEEALVGLADSQDLLDTYEATVTVSSKRKKSFSHFDMQDHRVIASGATPQDSRPAGARRPAPPSKSEYRPATAAASERHRPSRISISPLIPVTECSSSPLFTRNSSPSEVLISPSDQTQPITHPPPAKKMKLATEGKQELTPPAMVAEAELEPIEGNARQTEDEPAQKSSHNEEIDPWIMQEFGKYVKFV